MLGLWRFLPRLACGRYYTTHWAVILLEILLLDIPRTVLGLHPVAEVLLHIFLLEWLCVVVRSEEAFLSIFPRMVLKERPLRVARKAMVLPECHGGLKTDNGQTTWLLPRWVIPRQVRLPTSVVLDQVKKSRTNSPPGPALQASSSMADAAKAAFRRAGTNSCRGSHKAQCLRLGAGARHRSPAAPNPCKASSGKSAQATFDRDGRSSLDARHIHSGMWFAWCATST